MDDLYDRVNGVVLDNMTRFDTVTTAATVTAEDMDEKTVLGFRSLSDLGMFIMFVVLALAGIVVNLTFLYGAMKEKLYKASKRHVYIMNLALADLVIAFGILFFPTLNYVVIENSIFGQVSCKIFEIIRGIITPVTLLSLAVLSRERCRAVYAAERKDDPNAPAKRAKPSYLICFRMSGCNTIVLLWFFAGMTLVPINLMGHMHDRRIEDVGYTEICMLGRFEFLEPRILVVMRCIVTYVIPILVILYSYFWIGWKLFSWSALMRKLRPGRSGESCMTERIMRTTKRIFLLAFLVIISSGSCLYFLWVFVLQIDDVTNRSAFWEKWRIIGFYLFYLYPVLNPVFFYFTSRKYKALFDTYLFRKKKSDDASTTDQEEEDDDDEDDYVSAVYAPDESTPLSTPTRATASFTKRKSLKRVSSPA